jgi:hypothetical protein
MDGTERSSSLPIVHHERASASSNLHRGKWREWPGKLGEMVLRLWLIHFGGEQRQLLRKMKISMVQRPEKDGGLVLGQLGAK